MARSQNLDETIADALQRGGQSVQVGPKETVGTLDTKHHKVSRSNGKQLASACDAAAAEIQETGQTVVNIANTIAAEAEALAELLHKHGSAISARVDEFMTLSDRVKDRMRDAHNDVISASGPGPSLAPQAEHSDDEKPEI
jgi:ABC-type transporter Mla subunit MlaD